MNVEIGAEAALFPEKEYIKGIFVAVREENQAAGTGLDLRARICKHLEAQELIPRNRFRQAYFNGTEH